MLRTEAQSDGKFDKLWELMKEHLPSGAWERGGRFSQ